MLSALICLHFAPYVAALYCTVQRVDVNRCLNYYICIYSFVMSLCAYYTRVVLVRHTIVVPNKSDLNLKGCGSPKEMCVCML